MSRCLNHCDVINLQNNVAFVVYMKVFSHVLVLSDKHFMPENSCCVLEMVGAGKVTVEGGGGSLCGS